MFKAAAQRDINNLPRKIADVVLEFIYSSLSENPYRVGKPLHWEWEGHYAARRSSYRIVYTIDNDRVVVKIVKVAARPDAYRPR